MESVNTSNPLCMEANASTTTVAPEPEGLHRSVRYFVGLGLALSSSLFIGSSFIIKKKSLLHLAAKGIRASDGGMGYLTDWLWWSGLLTMAVGEAANFAAYAFVPASLVTPLGALSVLVTAVLAQHFLDEHLNLIGKLACLLCLLGSTVTILHAPQESHVGSVSELASLLSNFEFVVYVVLVIGLTVILIFFVAPRHGRSNVFVYVFVCSMVGSLSVMAVKGVGLAIVETFRPNGHNEFTNVYTYVLAINMVVCIAVQMVYLNKALDVFNTSVVSPIYYVMFTVFVMVASGILYGEFYNMSFFNIVGLLAGFMTTVVSVFMLHLFKVSPDGDAVSFDLIRPKKSRDESSKKYDDVQYQSVVGAGDHRDADDHEKTSTSICVDHNANDTLDSANRSNGITVVASIEGDNKDDLVLDSNKLNSNSSIHRNINNRQHSHV